MTILFHAILKVLAAIGFVTMLVTLPTSAQPAAGAATEGSTVIAQAAEPVPPQRTGIAIGAAGPGGTAVRSGHDLSPWSMFLAADIVVKAVMIALALASVATWTILIAKSVELFRMRRKLKGELAAVEETPTLAEACLVIGKAPGICPDLLAAAQRELRLSGPSATHEGIKERAASSFGDLQRAEARGVRKGMGTLATIGSISPFVGLFGTVWGIMNSFIGISKSQTTNLAVVAPGIAEALLATAIGLVAAIPAVIVYNHFSRSAKSYLELVSRAAGATGRLLSRDLDLGRRAVIANAAE